MEKPSAMLAQGGMLDAAIKTKQPSPATHTMKLQRRLERAELSKGARGVIRVDREARAECFVC